MSDVLRQLTALIKPSLFRHQKRQAFPCPLSLPSSVDLPVLEAVETEENEENTGTVLEEAMEDFSPPISYIPDTVASCKMLPKVDIPTFAVCKSLSIVALNSPASCPSLVGTKRPPQFQKTFHIYEHSGKFIMIGVCLKKDFHSSENHC